MRKLGLRGTFKNIFYRVVEIDGSVSKEPTLQREEEGGRGEGRGGRGRRKRIAQKRERGNGEHGEEEGRRRSEEEERGEEANTGMEKYTCNPSSEGAKMNESLGATGASSRPRDPT